MIQIEQLKRGGNMNHYPKTLHILNSCIHIFNAIGVSFFILCLTGQMLTRHSSYFVMSICFIVSFVIWFEKKQIMHRYQIVEQRKDM